LTPSRRPRSAAARKPTPRPASGPPPAGPAPLDTGELRARALALRAAELMLDKKALEVVVLDVRGMTSYADWLVLSSGESERQVSATAEHVREKVREEGHRTIGSEGFETGRWVLLDYGEVVMHLFSREVRAFYDLDGLWADAPRETVS
jgi:ribosome-associated protein